MTSPLFSREDILAIRVRSDDGEHPRSIQRDYPRASVITIARIGRRESFREIGTADERKLVAARLRADGPADTAKDSLLGLRRRLALEIDRAPPGGPEAPPASPTLPVSSPESAAPTSDPDAEIAALEAARRGPRADDLISEMLESFQKGNAR